MRPPQIVVLSFLIAIVAGTVLLSLPFATASGESLPLVDALFTATSATCVTGLMVHDTGTSFSGFGQAVILILFQVGGLGIMTLSTTFAILLGRKLTIRHNVVIQSALDHHRVEGLPRLIKYILLITFGVELAGASCLFLRWGTITDWSVFERIKQAIFHSVSAFCNAGFSLFHTSFAGFKGDVWINVIMMTLIFGGGIGFIVLLDIPRLKFWRRDRHIWLSKISLQTKLVLTVSICLIIAGSVLLFALEYNNAFSGFTLKEKVLGSLFQAITPRTAGFNTVPIDTFSPASLFLLIMMMFIGASPGSTGGGIKTCTFGVLIAAAWAMVHNKDNISVFKKTIPKNVFYRAFMIFVLALCWVFVFTIILAFVERGNIRSSNYFLKVLFEVTSAFGTVGLSTGITSQLSALGKILISMTMFAGRIGPLTLALALAMRKERAVYKYPEERVMVG